jgi:hypothetical protein
MKKTLIMTIAFSLFASSAFCVNLAIDTTKAGLKLTGDQTAATATTATIGRLSNKVVLGANYTTSGYNIETFYNFSPWKQGENKVYSTAYDSTSIFYSVPAAQPTGQPSAADSSILTSANGWTSM